MLFAGQTKGYLTCKLCVSLQNDNVNSRCMQLISSVATWVTAAKPVHHQSVTHACIPLLNRKSRWFRTAKEAKFINMLLYIYFLRLSARQYMYNKMWLSVTERNVGNKDQTSIQGEAWWWRGLHCLHFSMLREAPANKCFVVWLVRIY